MMRLAFFAFVAGFAACSGAVRPTPPPELPALTRESASNFARITLACVSKEYPNSPQYVLNAEGDVQPPQQVHPAFYGCYDWHSSVHGHWMLARLFRLFPDLPERERIVSALDANLTAKNVLTEAAYFRRPGTQAFERMYGWAWILKLAEELHLSSAPEAKRWKENLQPLADALVQRYLDFLPKQTYAIRTGLHPNTAFGLAFALDYASTVGHTRGSRSSTLASSTTDSVSGAATRPARLPTITRVTLGRPAVSRLPAPTPTASTVIDGRSSLRSQRVAIRAMPVGVVSSPRPPPRTRQPRASCATAGTGTGISPWATATRPDPRATSLTVSVTMPSRCSAAQTPTTSAMESSAPTSWKCTSVAGMPCT